ncbi:RdRP-domain-containing protein [Daedalea quercina L-15889]|uniref:RNA-dependent RNA polymerase n=1 Tax=Daedalea quercina L-15889 TaxID=1314783 RepID=A0A165UBZ2_9APHY|nr:RdRP-domain-containing protein [Daedalea quercina L-15889]
MEICMYNIAANVDEVLLKNRLADILHGPRYTHLSTHPIDFAVRIFSQSPPKRNNGFLTVPTISIAEQFLQEFGGKPAKYRLILGKPIFFKQSKRSPRRRQIKELQRPPATGRRFAEHREHATDPAMASVGVSELQFGYFCRDDEYSIEWKKVPGLAAQLVLDDARNAFEIIWHERTHTQYVIFRAASIYWIGAGLDSTGWAVVFFALNHAPSFQTSGPQYPAKILKREKRYTARLCAFDADHMPLAPYTSNAIRIICKTAGDLDVFRSLGGLAQVQIEETLYPATERALFAHNIRRTYQKWITRTPWSIAFQVEALVQASLVELREVLQELRPMIAKMVERHGPDPTSAFLHDFRMRVKEITMAGEGISLRDVWIAALDEFQQRPPSLAVPVDDNEDLFQCFHVIVTPTTMFLEGPFPEQSNRVIRRYKANQDCFIRVSFLDETRLAYRSDRNVNISGMIKMRVRQFLVEGLPVAGRAFEFLAYSQSGLKEHSVWFVKPFRSGGRAVSAASIIQGLGSFRALPYDPLLMYCPARYAARLSQAFTATDSALSVQTEDMIAIPDILTHDRQYCFTDGVGTLSPDLARAIWGQLRAKGRRVGHASTYPRLFQIRLGGSKGMLSVDHCLTGLAVGLRPSMTKFDAPHSLSIEIARAFDRPSKYYLNRPLIMLLEGLGTPYGVFQRLQDDAVRDAQRATASLDQAAHLLEAHGLGASYKLSSIMRNLHRLGVGAFTGDVFWQRMMDFAVNHVLRELKHHARIPVPLGWTLVGVADIYEYLQEDEIFACVDASDEAGLVYLEGPIMISRSPSIHPGDIQIVHAIGKPPEGSPYEREPLRNGVVFATKGRRPVSTCLGGGDLDGDVYNLTPMSELHPPKISEPAAYEPAVRMAIKKESTMEDVADFVTHYITNDTLGVVATHWLITADQREDGIFDEDCLKLSKLHSIAVDYPKTGRSVSLYNIPKLKSKVKPDWYAPETQANNRKRYYESQRAIGKLSRAIKLPALKAFASSRPRHMEDGQGHLHRDIVNQFHSHSAGECDVFARLTVRHSVEEFIYVSQANIPDDMVVFMGQLLASYASQLRSICAMNSISEYSGSAMLTEEEAMIGTIAEKTSQPRRRTDAMGRLRDHTERLVKAVRAEISGVDGTPPRRSLKRAWVAYNVGLLKGVYFGAGSFAWIALGEIFDAIRDIEEEERSLLRRAHA